MQCQSYLPLYYDLNMDANGSTRPVYTGHPKPSTGDFSQRLINFSVSEGNQLGYGKEFLRQTILQQEITFKGQVQELHRLYRRQRELLDEIKRTNHCNKNAFSELQWTPNLLTSNVSFSSSNQRAAHGIPFDSLGFSHPSASGSNIVQTPWASTKGESTASSSHVSVNVRSSNVLDLSLSRGNVARRKPLDLQLPADEYINSEGNESLNNYEASGVSILSAHASNKACSLAPLGNTKPLVVSSSPTSQMIDLEKFSASKHMWSGNFIDFPYKKKLKMCRDSETDNSDALQRWKPCGEDGKSRSNLYSLGWYSYSESLQRLAEAGQVHQTAPLVTKKDGWLDNGRRNTGAKIPGSIHEILDLNTPIQVGASHDIPILEFPATTYSGKVNPQVPTSSPCVDELDHRSRCGDIQEKGRFLHINCSESNVKASSAKSGFLFQNLNCDLASADNETAKRTTRVDSIDLNCTGAASCEETGLFDINLPCHLTTDMVRIEDDPVGNDQEHPNLINLDSNVKDDEIPRKVTEVDLEASIIPISPEKQECPRPRGQSEENKTLIQFSTREDVGSIDELMKVAADVLVSISSSEAQQCQASSNEMLIWFAGVVSSKDSRDVGSSGNFSASSSSNNAIDYFEAMTLKLTETSDDDYWSNTTTLHNEKEMCDAPSCVESSRNRTTARRVKRKNFQREVLPSLASLSRYEASEDIQIIEKLMESAGTPLQMGVRPRKRRLTGRNKTRPNVATSTTTTCWGNRICLLALPHMGIPAIDLQNKDRLRWENIPRQPRGKRHRTMFPSTSLSQQGWMKKWGGIGFVQNENKELKLG